MSGFYMIPKAPGEHEALPVKDSCYEERTQHPANLKNETSYPVIAVCQRCYGRIRLAVKAQNEWVHVTTEETEEEKQ